MIVNKNNDIGLIPIRTDTGNYFPKKNKYIIGTYTHIELEEAIKEGYEIIDIEYFKVRDLGNAPIKDATIRANFARPTTANESYKVPYSLIGQRLTQDDGTAFFTFDSDTFVLLTISAKGYEPQQLVLRIGDESATSKTLSIPVYMTSSTATTSEGITMWLPATYNKKHRIVTGKQIGRAHV